MPYLDTISIDSLGGNTVIDRIGEVEIVNDLTAPSAARFEVGDDGSWPEIKDAIAIGERFEVSVNGLLRMTGRLLSRRNPITVDAGSTIQLTLRTRLADAAFASAPPNIAVKDATLKSIILAAYKPMGLTEADFDFDADVARDVLTGAKRGGGKSIDFVLEAREDQAQVAPPETIYEFVERNLNRFGLSHWDGADGKIVVGAPDDSQAPLYTFRSLYLGSANNLLDAEKTEDFESVPTQLTVFGQGAGGASPWTKTKATVSDPILSAVSPALYRIVGVQEESVRTQAHAESRARREMSDRSRQKDAWRFTVSGLSYRERGSVMNYAPNTVADVMVDMQGGATGAYLVYRTRMSGNAEKGLTTEMDAVAQGIWRL